MSTRSALAQTVAFPRGLPAPARARARLKESLLRLCKFLGLFALARVLTGDALRILYYHGFSTGDLVEFRPKLFMRPETFARRLELMGKLGMCPLRLGEAAQRLQRGALPRCSIVITIDDGWTGTQLHAHRLLVAKGIPYTLYVATYYVKHRFAAFEVAVQYLFWRTTAQRFDASDIGLPGGGCYEIGTSENAQQTALRVVDFGNRLDSPDRRDLLLKQLARVLGVDLGERERELTLVDDVQLRQMAGEGADLELHTHNHRFPPDKTIVESELRENRAYLEPIVGARLEHFCYPSGIWYEEQLDWLKQSGISTATTTMRGFNRRGDSVLALRRYADGEDISELEFEARLSGFFEIADRFRPWARARRRDILRRQRQQHREETTG